MTKRLFSILLLLAVLAACVPAAPKSGTTWWSDDVFYEIFVRSFYDSNGDGIGDINGITEKLDYLNDGDPNTTTDLGVTGIWLMPIFPSPSYHGYDVTDYYSINPQYGTMDDFKNLLKEAHKRGIHVVIDMVLNHTSDQHPWFKSAKKDVNSPYRDWYIWSETDPGYKGPWGEKVWYPTLNGYYYGVFESFMPDLNYNNPEVTAEMTKIFSFWTDKVGVDGFRLDAAKHLIEEGADQQNTQSTHAWYHNFYPVYKKMNPNTMTIGEISGDGISMISRYVTDDELDLVFNFPLASAFVKAAQTGKANNIATIIETTNKFIHDSQYSPFLTNHDQNRVMSELGNDVGKAKVAASLLLTSPGTPFIYYGEEIGMLGTKPDQNIRRPMQWSADANAGFTTGKPWEPLDTNYPEVNVSSQINDADSLLGHYSGLIKVRNENSALRTGKFYKVKSNNPGVYATLRVDDSEIVLTLINLSDQPVTDCTLKLEDAVMTDGVYGAETLFGRDQIEGPGVSGGVFQNYRPVKEINPYITLIVKLNP